MIDIFCVFYLKGDSDRMERKQRQKRTDLIVDILFPVISSLILALFLIFPSATSGKNWPIGVSLLTVYIALCTVWVFILFKRREKEEKRRVGRTNFLSVMESSLQQPDIPMLAVDGKETGGKILWANRAACLIFDNQNLFGEDFDSYSPVTLNALTAGQSDGAQVKIGGKFYELNAYHPDSSSESVYFVIFNDVTRTEIWRSRYENNLVCAAFVLVDNLAELTAQAGKGEYRDAATLIDKILKEWAESMDGVIKELNNDRYLLFFNQKYLDGLCDSRFPVLDKIVSAQSGSYTVPLTVSIGVSSRGDTLAEREREALIALDHALQRGGAQAAVRRNADGYEFFGGRVKPSQKRTSIRSRIEAERLISLISRAGNVIIMGHANPDFDAIGSCIGISRLASACEKDAIIVTDLKCDNFRICAERLIASDEDGRYAKLFADSEKGLDAVRSDTLVILTDVNSVERCECPQIAQNCASMAIIDHHRRAGGNMTDAPDVNYVDPSASSACEIVSEMLEYAPMRIELSAEEASVMMSGIMLDTQNFIKSVGTRTFSAALFLRNAGASNEVANSFFFENMSDYTAQARLTGNVKLYRKKYVIAMNTAPDDVDARTAAAKAANKLLSLRGAEATFVLACVGDTVMISARSNGKINVQLILEQMGGGGHFDAAGAQVKADTESTLTKLQRAIDNYEDSTL